VKRRSGRRVVSPSASNQKGWKQLP